MRRDSRLGGAALQRSGSHPSTTLRAGSFAKSREGWGSVRKEWASARQAFHVTHQCPRHEWPHKLSCSETGGFRPSAAPATATLHPGSPASPILACWGWVAHLVKPLLTSEKSPNPFRFKCLPMLYVHIRIPRIIFFAHYSLPSQLTCRHGVPTHSRFLRTSGLSRNRYLTPVAKIDS